MPVLTEAPFHGTRTAEGPLMWAQIAMWRAIGASPDALEFNLAAAWEVPGAPPVDRVLAAVSALVSRHETLRTTYRPDGDAAIQRVTAAGAVAVEVVTCAEPPDRDQAETSAQQLRQGRFDPAADQPLRLRLLEHDGVRWIVVSAFHLALDGWSFTLLHDELLALVEDPAAALPEVTHPLDRVRFERSEAGQKAQRRSIAYWEQCLTEASPPLVTPLPDMTEQTVDYHYLVSPALAEAVAYLAAATHTTGSSVVLSGATLALSVACETPDAFIRVITATRFRSQTRHLLGAFNQEAPLLVRRDAETFADYCATCAKAALRGYMSCECDPGLLGERLGRVIDGRGIGRDGYCFFNDVRMFFGEDPSDDPGASGGLPGDDAVPGAMHRLPAKVEAGAKFFLTLAGLRGRAVVALSKDRRFLPDVPCETFLRGVERIVLRGAAGTLPPPARLVKADIFG